MTTHKHIMKKTHRVTLFLASASMLMFLAACVDDKMPSRSEWEADGSLTFGASIDNKISLASRGGELEPINPDDFGETVFYIYEQGLWHDGNNANQKLQAQVAPYWLESGALGQLDIMAGYEDIKLNWYVADTEHRFWSWTWPLDTRNYSNVDISNDPDTEVIEFIDSDFPLPTQKDADGNIIESNEPKTEAQLWKNGEALSRLVGTTTQRPYIFNQDGRYVPLTYRHLVSRIILGEFILIDNTGASVKDLKARITFYGMPKRAMFYPLPQDVDDKSVAPYVIIDPTDPYGTLKDKNTKTAETDVKASEAFKYDINQCLTFYISNEGGDNTNNGSTGSNPDADSNVHRDMFYICPEVDFTNLQYKVEFVEYSKDKQQYIPHTRYGNRGGYFGDFKSIQFKREIDGEEVVATDRILHAGEEMVINMTVYEKSGPGAGVWIRNWDTEKLKSATHHVHNGIYSDAEASGCRETLGSSSTSADQKNDAYGIYGEDEDIDGDGVKEKVVHVYSDISVSSNHFRLYPNGDTNYILDGMGYTLTFVNTSTTDKTPYKYCYIANARDIYLSNGIDTVYIDRDGYVWRIDKETGEYVITSERVTANNTVIYFNLDDKP